ncbi:MAG: hypothetical protein V4520_20875 [Bacteroidota bacterium]
MNAVIHDTLSFIVNITACALILGLIVFVNYIFSRDKVVTRTMRNHNN